MFEGRVTEDEPDYIRMREPGGRRRDLRRPRRLLRRCNQTLWFAVRPEKLRVTRERPDQAHNVFKAVVEEIAYLGNLSIYRLRLETGKVLQATKANLSRFDDDAISWDETVWVSWDDIAGVVLTQ